MKAIILLLSLALQTLAGLNIGRWQNGGLDIGRWQSGGAAGGGCTTQPSATNLNAACTVGVAYSDTMTSADADSLAAIDALPGGLSLTKTGSAIGKIAGTPTTQSVLDTTRIVAYACTGDSTDTALFIWTVAASDTFTLDTNAVNGSITLDPAPETGDKYHRATEVTLTAVPDTWYKFVEWSDSLTGSTNPESITMDTNKVVTATFEKDSVFIYDVTPDSGFVGTVITISCLGVGAEQGASTIAMGGVDMGTTQSWSNTQIVDTVPSIDTGWQDFIVVGHWNSDTLENAFKVLEAAAPCTLTLTNGTHCYLTSLEGGTIYSSGDSAHIKTTTDAGYAYKINAGIPKYTTDTIRILVTGNASYTGVSYAIPVIDSVRDSTALRDSTYKQAARPLDTINIYGSGFSTTGDSAKFYLNSSGILSGTLRSVSDTKVVAVVPTGTPRGWYSCWWRTKDLIAGTPKYHGLLIKRPGGL